MGQERGDLLRKWVGVHVKINMNKKLKPASAAPGGACSDFGSGFRSD